MKKSVFILGLIALLLVSACSTSQKVIVPLSEQLSPGDTYTLIWYGKSEAYRYLNDQWKRDPAYDYEFDVVQKRYPDVWKSIKSLHRRHPDYDGKAGPRSQAMYFELAYTSKGATLETEIRSSLGSGSGSSDLEFRKQSLDFEVSGISAAAPYNRIRIEQDYQYEKGLLLETVLLYKRKDGKEVPFMKNEEKAFIFTRDSLAGAPRVGQ